MQNSGLKRPEIPGHLPIISLPAKQPHIAPLPGRTDWFPWFANCSDRPLAHGKDPYNCLGTRSMCGTLAE
jgi:hypothetical protein